ncbi:MAG TPA: flagellar basal body L-ring protein FlgH [Steroidobacteraceae bacterium]|nr:flagellar basal body L-ring protein FlgH [Steroidobacteraceae bacterium]
MRTSLALLGLAAALAAAGCHTTRATKPDDGLAWTQEKLPPPSDGAIYQAGREVVLAENPIAHHVGDIVTIVLNEATVAQKSATTTTSKANTIAMTGTQLLNKNVSWLNNNVNNASKFDGEGASAQSNSLTGYLTATVLKVLPNGNLYISGEKQIGLNQGKEFIRVTGVIRPIDLAADDSIPSYRVASAKIAYSGKGAINDANTQSWLARFFNSPWMPF